MNYMMDGANSMRWNTIKGIKEDIKIEITDIPPRDKFKYSYDLWTNGLSMDAFGIGRTYKATIRSVSRGKGLWLLNFDSIGRLINSSFSGTEWEGIKLPSNKRQVNLHTLKYPDRYRPEMHRLVGGTWLLGKWTDHEERTSLTYVPDILLAEHPFYQMTMKALDLFVTCIQESDVSIQSPESANILKKYKELKLLTADELHDEMKKFHKIVGFDHEIPVEPPELSKFHYHALPILVENGCGGSCTYCNLYQRKIRVCQSKDVYKRINDLVEYLGEEVDHFERIVLLEGDVLKVPSEQLINYLEYAKKKFNILSKQFAHAFSKASTVCKLTDEELVNLKESGLNNINMGLETGCQKLMDAIKPGQTLNEFHTAVDKLTEAGINVSVNLIAGAGGKVYSDAHIKETISFLKSLPVGVKKYFSPLFVPKDCKYEKQQDNWQALSDEEIEQQCQIFRNVLEADEYMFIPI